MRWKRLTATLFENTVHKCFEFGPVDDWIYKVKISMLANLRGNITPTQVSTGAFILLFCGDLLEGR